MIEYGALRYPIFCRAEMYTVIKKIAFSAAHRLTLDYESKCCRLHGHEWHVTVYVRAAELDRNGMVIDFTEIKRKVTGKLDHSYLNEVLDFNPTAENIAKWISDTLTDGRAECYRVEVQESDSNTAVFER